MSETEASESDSVAGSGASGRAQHPSDGESPTGVATIPVTGMTCAGCADNVQVALSQVHGVGTVEVDVDRGEARVQAAAEAAGGLDEAELRAAVERIGYVAAAPSPDRSARQAGRRPWVMAGLVVVALVAGVAAFRSVNAVYETAGTLQQLNGVFDEVSVLAFGLAALIGLVVAFAPSSLAMAPAIMGYVSTSGTSSTRRAGGLSALFLLGMLLTNIALGALFALGGKAVMQAVGARAWVWYGVVAVLLVVMALILLGVWRPRLPSYRPSLPGLRRRDGGGDPVSARAGEGRAGGAFALGVPFGLMACPACTPLLMPLALGAAATGEPVYGAALMGVFGLGRGVPMVVLGTFTGTLQAGGGSLARTATVIQRILGVVLLVAAGYFVWSALYFVGVL